MALSRFILPFADVGEGIKPADGAKLFFYETGISTPKDTYSDSVGTTPNANPVVADASGVFSDIFIEGLYKVVLQDKNGVQKWEADPVTSAYIGDLSAIARSLNVLDSQVIYSTDKVTVLDNVLYIYDAGDQVTWGKPSGVGAGEVIVGVVDDQLQTDIAFYTMSKVELKYTLEFSNVANMQAGVALNGVTSQFYIGQRLSTGGGLWTVNNTSEGLLLAGGFYAKPYGHIFVTDFGLTDANLDEALVLSGSTKRTAILPFATVTYTEEHSFPIGANIKGAKKDQYADGFGIDPLSSTILFEPTTPKSLFVADGTSHGGFRFHNSIRGTFIKGNANAVNALQLNGVIYGAFKDLSIVDFDVPVLCDATINNLFENVYLSGREHSLVYAGNLETTDTWTHCSFWGSTIGGINFLGSSIAIRFIDSLFEQCGAYGANIAKECQNIMFHYCYGENVPFDNDANGAVFRVGYDGTTAVIENNIQIIGGKYGGRNAGTVGYFLDCDDIQSAQLYSVDISRFVNPVRVTANTKDNAILTSGCTGISWTGSTFITGPTGKVQGNYPNTVINGGGYSLITDSRQLKADIITPRDGSSSLTINPTNIQMSGIGGAIYPSVDNDVVLGLSNLIFESIRLGVAPIITSDERLKTTLEELDDKEIAVGKELKGCIKKFKFIDMVDKKGDKARIHVGVGVQTVQAVFAKHGLDASEYSMFCYDEWGDQYEDIPAKYEDVPSVLDSDGKVIEDAKRVLVSEASKTLIQPAGNRYAMRYEELFAFILAAL